MKYTLKAQSIAIIRNCLGFPGWAKTIDQVYHGGKLMVDTLPKIKDGTPVETTVEVELEGPDRDLVKVALEHAIAKEVLPVSEFTTDIITSLELVAKKG